MSKTNLKWIENLKKVFKIQLLGEKIGELLSNQNLDKGF